MSKFDLGSIQANTNPGMDALFESQPELVTPAPRIRIASLIDFDGFIRISEDTLIHKSQQDLWRLAEDEDGVYVERLFPEGTLVKD